MTTRDEWLALAEKCATASGPNFALEQEIGLVAGVSHSLAPAYTASLDAIVGLIAAQLPGWYWSVEEGGFAMIRSLTFRRPDGDVVCRKSASPALALCTAFCLAMAVTTT